MGYTLLSKLTKIMFTFFALSFFAAIAPVVSYAQSAGDIAFVGFNADGEDDFAIVTLAEIPAHTTIYFTNERWEGRTFDGEGKNIIWQTGASVIPAGTVVTFNNTASERVITASIGSISEGFMNLAAGNEVLFAYAGNEEGTPTTFLAALATTEDAYSGTGPDPDGTLDGTGLRQGSTAILLSDNVDAARYAGDRSGNTQRGYLAELNDIANNWIAGGGKGDQSGMVLPFDEMDFAIVNPPALAFTVNSLTASENDGTATIEIELAEANGTGVEVDIAFASGPSSASGPDINNYSTQTVGFSGSDPDGTTKTVTVHITGDADYEGNEMAVFKLQNNTAGSIIKPGVLNLIIQDDDAPDIVINEFLADPGSDVNGDGIRDTGNDEFVEVVNNESADIDISGWYLSADGGTTITHTFPSGTVLPAGGAAVVFGGGSPSGSFGGAIVQTAGSLRLTKTGGQITLHDAGGNIIQDITYGSIANENQSVTRFPDITGSLNTKHSEAARSGGALFSPGTKADGSPFGANFAIGIRGGEGWRMISTPTHNTSFNDLFGDFWMQGIPGSHAPTAGAATIYAWNEQGGGTFLTPSHMSDKMEAGKGYIVYFFEDDEFNTPGIQGGFPKIINSNETENNSTVSVVISSEDADGNNILSDNEGWNLLGNPFGTDILVDELLAAIRSALQSKNPDYDINAHVYIWDHSAEEGNGAYIDLAEGSGKTIAPFQAFWVRVDTVENGAGFSVNAYLEKDQLAANKKDTRFYKERNGEQFSFTIALSDGTYYDRYHLEFNEKGSIDLDRYDAYKLFSLQASSINLYSLSGDNKLMKNTLPVDLDASLEVPLHFNAPGRESLSLDWEGLENLPESWEITLFDRTLNKEINLRLASKYSFAVPGAAVKGKANADAGRPQLNKTKAVSDQPRFVLSVSPVASEETSFSGIPESVKLNPNYPNPFNPTTTISYELKEDSEVLLSIWNIVGQKVVTLADGMKEAGEHTATWNASEMPSGIYIAQLRVGGKVFIRKMTLIK